MSTVPTRRQALRAGVGLASLPPTRRPNIITILLDDQRWDAFSAYGKPGILSFLKTPNMDRLAREGVHFRNAFCTTSLCSPSRASIMSGKYVHTHGVSALEGTLPPGCAIFPQALQAAGYETGFVGKWHLGKQSDTPQPGFDFWAGFRGQGAYFNPVMNVNGTRTPTNGYVTDVLTGYALDFVSRQRDKPFFLHLAHKAPHDPCTPPKHLESLYDGFEVPLPNTYYEKHEDKPAWFLEFHDHDFFHVKFHPPDRYQTYVKNYCRSLVSVDENLGRLLKLLDDRGLTENTAILWLSDNGHFLAEHQLFSKMMPYEESMRIPLLVRWPGHVPAGSHRDEIALNVDIAPTVLEMAGVKPQADMEGRSFLRLAQGRRVPDWRQSFLFEYFAEGGWGLPSLEAVRSSDGWMYARYPDWEQLYWMAEDPYQIRNLAANPKYASRKNALAAELRKLGGGKDLHPPYREGPHAYKRMSEPVHTPHPPD
jgi:N-acetylglucosamine-6-sulfatase